MIRFSFWKYQSSGCGGIEGEASNQEGSPAIDLVGNEIDFLFSNAIDAINMHSTFQGRPRILGISHTLSSILLNKTNWNAREQVTFIKNQGTLLQTIIL